MCACVAYVCLAAACWPLLRVARSCYPPYMQGLGYVLSRDLVQLLGSVAPTLKVYTNEDMMVGTWLVGHHVNRGRLVARQFSLAEYQTTLSECFPLYYNHKVPSFVMAECTHFHGATGLCWQPKARPSALAGTSVARIGPARAIPTIDASSPANLSPLTSEAERKYGSALDAWLASAIAAPAHVQSGPALARVVDMVTVGIKAVTHLRNHVHFILHSIHRRYPGIRIIVADGASAPALAQHSIAAEALLRLCDALHAHYP